MRSSKKWKDAAAILALGVCLIPCGACGGNGGSAGVVTEDLCFEFAASEPAASGTVSAQEGAGFTCDLAEIDLVVTDVDGVCGATLNLQYEAAVTLFAGIDETPSFLASDGAAVRAIWEDIAGNVTLSLTRLGQEPGIDVEGTELLVKLFFFRFADTTGSDTITLTDNCLMDCNESPEPLPGIACSGGTLTVR